MIYQIGGLFTGLRLGLLGDERNRQANDWQNVFDE